MNFKCPGIQFIRCESSLFDHLHFLVQYSDLKNLLKLGCDQVNYMIAIFELEMVQFDCLHPSILHDKATDQFVLLCSCLIYLHIENVIRRGQMRIG